MNATATPERTVAKKRTAKAPPEAAPYELTRVSSKALEVARIACAYEGMSLAEYLSRVILDVASRDADKGHANRFGKPKSN